MRIVHFSDWHWGFEQLPEADLYVCTGDMLPNFTWCDTAKALKKERIKQAAAVARWVAETGGMVPLLGSPKAPVVCLRGNHDFISLAPMFAGCNLIHEFVGNEVVEACSLRVTGHRGVPTINNTWSDEVERPDLLDRFRAMDRNCDLYLTHYPAGGIGLDLPGRWGLDEVDNWFYYNGKTRYPIHMFGHVHECGGMSKRMGDVWYSNAACSINVFEGTPIKGWDRVRAAPGMDFGEEVGEQCPVCGTLGPHACSGEPTGFGENE
jgi:Icc-related predicted phosphoesterase